MKGHPPARRKKLSGAFRRSLLGAILLGLSGLACIFGALILLAAPKSNGFTPAYLVDQKHGWTGRRGLQAFISNNHFIVEKASDRGFEKGQERSIPSISVAGLLGGSRKGPGRMRQEAEKQLALRRKQSKLHSVEGIDFRTSKERETGREVADREEVASRPDVKEDGDLRFNQVEKLAGDRRHIEDPPRNTLPQHLWGTYAKLARQPLIMSESRLHETGRISCGGSGTVGFRTWRELARSIQEFDARWSSEEPDLRALVAAAQNTASEPGHKPTCAVVGNSGRLLQHEHGAEIDTREMVIRFNWGTTSGYEKHVGSRSDVRIYNGPYVSQKQPGEVTIAEIRDPALRQWVRRKKKESAEHAVAFDPEFLCHVWDWVGRSGDKPSTGLVGVILALRTCSTVDLFGFHYEDYFDPAIQPHYYDWERPKVGREKAHPFEREYQLYKQLESAGLLHMH